MTLNPLPVGFLDHTVLVHATIPSISDYLLLNVGKGNPCFRLESHKHGYIVCLLTGKFPIKGRKRSNYNRRSRLSNIIEWLQTTTHLIDVTSTIKWVIKLTVAVSYQPQLHKLNAQNKCDVEVEMTSILFIQGFLEYR